MLLIAHAHLLRVLTARWLGLPASYGYALVLDPAGVGLLDTEHDLPVLRRWNTTATDTGLLADLHRAPAPPPSTEHPTEKAAR